MQFFRPKIYLGKNKAEKHVVYLAKHLKIPVPKRKNFDDDFLINIDSKKIRVNFQKEIHHTVHNGRANMLQAWFDSMDIFLQPALEMSSPQNNAGVSLNMSGSMLGHNISVKSGGAIESPELALARDICHFHKQACESYNIWEMKSFSRSFRGFLHSCVSLVDCFLYRYVSYIKANVQNYEQYENVLKLGSRKSMEERLEAWMNTLASHELNSFKNWPERSKLLELKNKRNEFVHPSSPMVKFEPIEVVKYLNYGATGVGKLLGRMRTASGATNKIGFIHQVSHLPKIIVKKK